MSRPCASNFLSWKTGEPAANPLAHVNLHSQRTTENPGERRREMNAETLEASSGPSAKTRSTHDFSRVQVYANAPARLQAKLDLNAPGDIYAQKAGGINEQLMRMPGPQLQRACACGGGCSGCQAEQSGQEDKRLQAQQDGSSDSGESAVPPVVHEVLRSPGQPLDDESRRFMEPRFGQDFSAVRLHTGAQASESARAVNARAYTVGQDIVFAAGQYLPQTAAGRHLLAHELAHTVQQRGASQALAPVSLISTPNDAAEREASMAADAVSGGASFAVTEHPQHIARDEEPTQQPPLGPPAPEQSPAGQPQAEAEGRYACVEMEQIPIITTPVVVFDDLVMMQTDVDIIWKTHAKMEPIHAASYCSCTCGEYRQYVKGHIIRNGQRFDIGLCDGAKLNENTWQEDGDAATGVCYGHRDRKETVNDKFDGPDRQSGCHYHGKDEPRVPGKPGDMIDVDLKFKGQTYDKCQDKFGQIHSWAFTYKGPLGGAKLTP